MSYWDEHALPVLAALAASAHRNVTSGFVSVGHGRAARTLELDMTDVDILQALLALGDAGYLQWNELGYETAPGAHFSGLRVTGAGLQALGQWPYFELLTTPQTLAATFDALSDLVADEERPALLRARDKALELSREGAKAAVIGAAGYLARGAAGLS
jgi:hypothetical protein